MKSVIEVLNPGFGTSIQDQGRFGARHMGITISGALDPLLARCANALVDNAVECACLEIRAKGPRLVVRDGPVALALAGNLAASLQRENGSIQSVLPWTTVILRTNDVLDVGLVRDGTAYLAVSGGVDTPSQLGSRSLYQRALIGGLEGNPLARGDLLPCAVCAASRPEHCADPWFEDDGPIRVILGPQDAHFTPESIELFLSTEYQITPQMDRMGVRLDGAVLTHISPEAADIVSDGVTPGTIQVPGNGQPIVLLADCQTVGGYAKIATVISADLPRFAHFRAGQGVRFSVVDATEAKQARLECETRWSRWLEGIDDGLPNPFALELNQSGCWGEN